jgi:hypothetical protein
VLHNSKPTASIFIKQIKNFVEITHNNICVLVAKKWKNVMKLQADDFEMSVVT